MPNPGHITPPGEPPASIVVPLPKGLPRTLVSEYIDACREDLSALNGVLVAQDGPEVRVVRRAHAVVRDPEVEFHGDAAFRAGHEAHGCVVVGSRPRREIGPPRGIPGAVSG
jgi:hypothetical protein